MLERLKKLCKENNTNITALCVEVTGSKGNLATWNKGHMRSDYLLKCAEILNVSTDYLLGKESFTTEQSKMEEVINMTTLYRDYLECCKNEGKTEKQFALENGITDEMYKKMIKPTMMRAEAELFCEETGTSMNDMVEEYIIVGELPLTDVESKILDLCRKLTQDRQFEVLGAAKMLLKQQEEESIKANENVG